MLFFHRLLLPSKGREWYRQWRRRRLVDATNGLGAASGVRAPDGGFHRRLLQIYRNISRPQPSSGTISLDSSANPALTYCKWTLPTDPSTSLLCCREVAYLAATQSQE
jgi:hypothetical protein